MADVGVHASGMGVSADAPLTGVAPVNRRVIAVGGIVFAVLMALSTRYGFQRDEVYFLDCARHLQASYVDQPVLAPLLARVSLALFGVSLPGLRLWPALAAWATVLVGGLTAREFGGGRRAQLLAAVATATMPALWGSAHVANTTAYAVLALAALALVVARIGRTGDPRWWLAAGLVVGLGVADNHQPGFFALALVIGALLSGGRRFVFNRWFAAGAAIAVAFVVPDIWWQAQHQWATVAMTRELNRENGGLRNIPVWVIGQLFLVTLALVWVWVAGLRLLWRSGRPLWRALAWAYGLLFVLYALTTGAKIYYLTGAYVYLLAAGAVAVDGWLYARPGRVRNLMLATTLTTAVFALLVLPVLPPALLRSLRRPSSSETVGMRTRRPRPAPVPRSAFAGFRFPPDVIVVAVRWYLRYGLSYRDIEELLAERGIEVDHVTIYRWVQRFTPLLADAARPCRHVVGDRWYVDETYVKVAGQWRYVYRAVDQFSQVIDVFVSSQRDARAARGFFEQAIAATKVTPVEVVSDRAPTYPTVLEELLPAAWHRTDRYANNRIECDHGRLKARLRPMRGLKQDHSARVIIVGHAFVQNVRRGFYELAVEEPVTRRLAVAFDELAMAI